MANSLRPPANTEFPPFAAIPLLFAPFKSVGPVTYKRTIKCGLVFILLQGVPVLLISCASCFFLVRSYVFMTFRQDVINLLNMTPSTELEILVKNLVHKIKNIFTKVL